MFRKVEKKKKSKGVYRRDIAPDAIYRSELVSRFINRLMVDGKKSVAERVFYAAIDQLQGSSEGKKGIDVFLHAIQNISPEVEVRSRRIGGATYQVPVRVSDKRKMSLSIRWMINYARLRSERGMVSRLVGELKDAVEQRGGAFKKKEEVFRAAEANKAFAHYGW